MRSLKKKSFTQQLLDRERELTYQTKKKKQNETEKIHIFINKKKIFFFCLEFRVAWEILHHVRQ